MQAWTTSSVHSPSTSRAGPGRSRARAARSARIPRHYMYWPEVEAMFGGVGRAALAGGAIRALRPLRPRRPPLQHEQCLIRSTAPSPRPEFRGARHPRPRAYRRRWSDGARGGCRDALEQPHPRLAKGVGLTPVGRATGRFHGPTRVLHSRLANQGMTDPFMPRHFAESDVGARPPRAAVDRPCPVRRTQENPPPAGTDEPSHR